MLTPTTTAEIAAAVRAHPGPISIGGGRYSMGGQTATAGALHIDLRQFNQILAFSPAGRRIRVQAGARWRDLHERIDPADLSIAIMQSYANFTVGGSLSVNAHGRYVGSGPIIQSVREIQVVLADGTIVEASRETNQEIFYGAIGGYGGLGVITEVTLDLAVNRRLLRQDHVIPVADYPAHFETQVRRHPGAILHNADIYPKAYETLRAVTYIATEAPVTVSSRLRAARGSSWRDRGAYWAMTELPFGGVLRRHVFDPLLFRGAPVTWRNYEASYDVSELEPASRTRSTYLLQEYFVPFGRFAAFLPRMRDILRRGRVNVVNVSTRHATADPGSLLAWARHDVFAFVIYYKQATGPEATDAAGVWSRELIEAALDLDGTFYLPYQLHATPEQFRRAYPRAPEFLALKRRIDPSSKFRNELWNKYGASAETSTRTSF